MLKKVFNGEFPLRTTFWKYGVFGLIILYYAYKMFKNLAGSYANGSNWVYIFRNFSVSGLANVNAFWVLTYLAVSLFLVIYSYGIIKGIWRSAASYDKSIWLAQLARIIIIGMVSTIWYLIIEG